ncbi:MAG TPA: type II toxin-antitoxin system antitoxin, RelB/DinJ family [Lentisphaeria bacterium]|nr:type II toxin-antitoxin system antitoxin, RelB/DinJ family [Lentisphaeria bacterium]HCG51545.1 type II toxin-antitoxin system antitoxin, RelB/DinJ family [Lentisphaeria bacterium]
MAISTFSVRMESDVKNELDKVCAQLGLNTSVAINIFARTVIREKRIPFEISLATGETAGANAFQALRKQAKANGVQGMSLSEINSEIDRARGKK